MGGKDGRWGRKGGDGTFIMSCAAGARSWKRRDKGSREKKSVSGGLCKQTLPDVSAWWVRRA